MNNIKIIFTLVLINISVFASDFLYVNHNNLSWDKVLHLILILLIIAFIIILIQRNLNKKQKYILNSAIEGMAILKNKRVVDANEPLLKLLNYTSINEIKNKTLFDFVDKKDHAILEQKMESSNDPYEISLIKSDGTIFPALVRGTNISCNKRVSTFIDLTELKKTQEKLEELNANLEKKVNDAVEENRKKDKILAYQTKLAAMGEMLNNIAHQWRQPLTEINATVMAIDLELLKNKYQNKEIDRFLEAIELQTKYMSNTIDNFRDFFMPNKEKDDFLISLALEKALEISKSSLDKYNINVEVEVLEDKLIHGYLGEFIQVIITILNNAKDALQNCENETLKICIKIDKNLTIEDNGGGISEENIERIFEPYFTTKHKNVGTGIGLYMAKMIVEDSMNGQLQVKNTKNGALFKINI